VGRPCDLAAASPDKGALALTTAPAISVNIVLAWQELDAKVLPMQNEN
jgi:hypothetical protein